MNPSRMLLIATWNSGKFAELRELLKDVPVETVSLMDMNIELDVEETGETFAENAALKAEAYCEMSGLLTLADDSGLVVDALGGEPGVRSARYAGPDATDADRISLLLSRMQRAQSRSARFVCAIAIAAPRMSTEFHFGSCEGVIASKPCGSGGFGYDPVFLLPELGLTMAQLDSERKNMLSHRAAAARRAAQSLGKRFSV